MKLKANVMQQKKHQEYIHKIAGTFLALFVTTNLYKSYLPKIFGVDLTIILAAICSLLLFVYLLRFKIIVSKTIFLLWSAICLLYIFSYFYTPSINYAKQKLVEILLFNSVIIFSSLIVFSSEEGEKYFYGVIVSFGMVLVLSLMLSLNIKNINGLINILGLNYLVYSRHLLFVSIFFMRKYLASDNYFRKIVNIALSVLCFYGILISGARSTAIFLVIIILLFIFYNYKKNKSYRIVLLIFIAIYFLTMIFKVDVGRVAFERIKIMNKNSDVNSRANYLKVSIDIIESKPLLGAGVGAFPIYFSSDDKEDYPHNLIMEIIDEIGLLGVSVFLLMLIAVSLKMKWRLGIYKKRKNYEMIFYELSIFYYIIMMFLFSSIGAARLAFASIALLYSRKVRNKIPV